MDKNLKYFRTSGSNFIKNISSYFLFISSFFLFLLFVFLSAAFTQTNSDETKTEGIKIYKPGESIVNFILSDVNKKKINFSSYRADRAAIISFWLPSCDKCLEELKKLKNSLEKKNVKNVAIITIVRGKDKDEIKETIKTLKENKLNFLTLLDPTFETAQKFQASPIPSFFLVDKNGVLRIAKVHEINKIIRRNTFMDLVDMARSGKEIPITETLPPDNPGDIILIGKPAPNFMLHDLKGDMQSILYYKGFKRLIIVFWSPTCPHCMREIPRLQKFYSKYKKQYNFEVLAITRAATKDMTDSVKKVAADNMLTFPVILDSDGSTADKYKASRVPFLFFVDNSGIVFDVAVGETEKMDETFSSIFEQMR